MIPMLHIGQRVIGQGEPCYIIAEMSANHNQSFDTAAELVHAARESGADAIKLQTYTPDTLTINCSNEHFRVGKGTIWEGRNLYQLYSEASTPWEWQPKLAKLAKDLGMDCFSTPFDASSVEFLEKMNVPAHKIASFELIDLGLVRRIAGTGKPIIMSTGMATLGEIDEAVRALRKAGCKQLALLKCTSAYPSRPEDMNLKTIPHMGRAFGVPTGLSDHTLGIAVPVAAVALGACIIEKHFTLARAMGGPDAAFSLEPAEFKAMVEAVRLAERALGNVQYEPTEREVASRVFRRSLFVVESISAGEQFTERNVRSIRPGFGLPPKNMDVIIGKRAARDIERGTPLAWDMIS
jgi:pseudaminic acid synthase